MRTNFSKMSNLRLVKNGFIYDFARVRDYMWLFEISYEAYDGDWVHTSNVITEIEAECIYNKLNN